MAAGIEGLVTIASAYAVEETVARLKAMLQARGVALFAVIDHSGEAQKVGLAMPPTRLLIFGSPKAGTPLMLKSPSSAIDLPLKILVAEDADGVTQVSYNSAAYLLKRHGLPEETAAVLAAAAALAEKAAA